MTVYQEHQPSPSVKFSNVEPESVDEPVPIIPLEQLKDALLAPSPS